MSSSGSKSILNNDTYIHFRFSVASWPFFVAVYPLSYVIPTCFVILKITLAFLKDAFSKRTRAGLDPLMFLVITLAYLMNLLDLLSDCLASRIPASGLLTVWCARSDHGVLLILVLILNYYLFYISLGFPFLVSAMRLIYMLFPWTHKTINARLLKVMLPLIAFSPLFSVFWLFPASGECRQLWEPYPFGSVFIGYTDQIDGMRATPFFVVNIIVWMGATCVVNLWLLVKVLQAKKKSATSTKSKRRRNADLSVSLTTASLTISGFAAVSCSLLYAFFPSIASYLAIIRPLGTDCEVVVPPWVFYRTHPTFRRERRAGKEDRALGSVINVSTMYKAR